MTYDKMTDVERVARAIARATIEAAEPEKYGRISDAGINEMVENLAVKFYPEARAAIAALQSAAPVDDDVRKESAFVTDALRSALYHRPELRARSIALIERLSSTGGQGNG